MRLIKAKNVSEMLEQAKNQAENNIIKVESRVKANYQSECNKLKRFPLTKRLEETRNQRAILNYHSAVKSWQRARSQLDSVMDRGEEFRTKLEVNEMMDRGLTLKEKYGGDKGWKL